MDLVSIIVPFYNVEDYLYDCLNSLSDQTYKCIEVILVNDGSNDGSRGIAEKFCQEDKRYIMIDQPNRGVSAARNTALRHISGEYVVFIDSDDWMSNIFVEVLLNNIKAENSDFACCRLEYVNKAKGRRHVYGKAFRKPFIEGKDILRDSLLVENISTPVWSKIYKVSFLRKFRLDFKEGIVNEDTLFTSLASIYAQKVSFVNEVLFYSLEREGSLSRASYKRLLCDMDIALSEVKIRMCEEDIFTGDNEAFYYTRYIKSMLYNLLQAAQRLPYSEYMEIYTYCLNHTHYFEYREWACFLPVYHRILFRVSNSSRSLYNVLRILNKIGFYMH